MLEVELQARVGPIDIEVDLAVSEGPLVLAGPNGAGKTSLLLLILGLLPPDRGRIAIGGDVLFDSAHGIDLPPEDRGLGYVPQDYALFPHLNVVENVAFGARDLDGSRRVDRLLEEMEIAALRHREPRLLSGGEKQRAALARALAPQPRALLLDEPLAALDVSAKAGSRLPRQVPGRPTNSGDRRHAQCRGRRRPRDADGHPRAGKSVQRGTYARMKAGPQTPFVVELVASLPLTT